MNKAIISCLLIFTCVVQTVAQADKQTKVVPVNGSFYDGYYGPHPPPADKPHHYHFQVFALDTALNLPAGFNRQALLDAMRGHVLGKGEVTGTYQRRPDVREKQ